MGELIQLKPERDEYAYFMCNRGNTGIWLFRKNGQIIIGHGTTKKDENGISDLFVTDEIVLKEDTDKEIHDAILDWMEIINE